MAKYNVFSTPLVKFQDISSVFGTNQALPLGIEDVGQYVLVK